MHGYGSFGAATPEPLAECAYCPARAQRGSDLCVTCALKIRVEVNQGLGRLSGYLAKWAAFRAFEARTTPAPFPKGAP